MRVGHLCFLQKRRGRYYYRVAIPQDLRQYFHGQEFKRSLHTKDLKIAARQIRLYSAKMEQVFLTLRTGVLTPKQVEDYLQRQLEINSHREPKKIVKRQSSVVKPRSLLLGSLIKAYLREHIERDKWCAKTQDEATIMLRFFVRFAGNVPISTVTRQTMVDYLGVLKRLPARLNMRTGGRDLSIADILKMRDVAPIGTTTINRYLERVGSLFIWCRRHGYIDRNPAEGLSIAKERREEEERAAYAHDDLQRLLDSLRLVPANKPECYWIPLIGMYSGMRLNEICQLYVEDVLEVEGVWCFDINNDKDKRIKNLASKRQVPVHPRLIELGLLEYVEKLKRSNRSRLWGNLQAGRDGHSNQFGKWYQRHNRQYVTTDPLKVFHSFRHTVANTLKQAGVAESVIAEILGHANHSITTGRYGKRYRPGVLLEALIKLDY